MEELFNVENVLKFPHFFPFKVAFSCLEDRICTVEVFTKKNRKIPDLLTGFYGMSDWFGCW